MLFLLLGFFSFLSCWTLLNFIISTQTLKKKKKDAIWNSWLISPLAPQCHNTSVPKPEAWHSVCANWEGQACVCFLHLPDIITNHKTNLYVQPWILWFLGLEVTQMRRFKEKCIISYCFTSESLPLIRTQCIRNMLMYMKMKTLYPKDN